MMERSSATVITGGEPRLRTRRTDGAPVYDYPRAPGVPAVSVGRLTGGRLHTGEALRDHAHAHDFMVLAYFERGGGSLRIDRREWPLADGDAFLIAPGEVVGGGGEAGHATATAWFVFFPPDVLRAGGFMSWRAHPLLFAFVGAAAGGVQRLRVPPADRAAWSERFTALERELSERRDGYDEAVPALLTLLLVGVSRLCADVAGELRLADEPLLAAVFERIEAGAASLADVAGAVGLTPGHLTTTVRRRTGRTVQQWIAERRMVEARRLLAGTDLTVAAIGERAGFGDPSYFVRAFRRAHAMTPQQWRRAAGAQRRSPPAR
jgi:AraC-like DNA-binding protein